MATPQTTAAPAATPSPLPIGDACLVGIWRQVSYRVTDRATLFDVPIALTGAEGALITLTADGAETFDYSNSGPITGGQSGHILTWQYRGVITFTFHGLDGKWSRTDSEQSWAVTNMYLDGRRQADSTELNPSASGSYTCAGQNLTLVETTPYSATTSFART